MFLSPLDNRHRQVIFHLLMEDVNANLFLLDILMRRGISSWGYEEWNGVFDQEQLIAVCVVMGRLRKNSRSRLIFAYGDPAACELFGEREAANGGSRMIVGPRSPSDGVWKGMGKPDPRILYDQRLYVCENPPVESSLALRYAQQKDLDILIDFSAEMMREDLLQDPRIIEPEIHKIAVQSRIRDHKTLVGEHQGQICFILDIGTYFRLGAQVGGTYVPPAFRGKGIATQGMRGANQWLLRGCDRVTLHVHEQNKAAIRCYIKSGFQPSSPYRLISFHHEK